MTRGDTRPPAPPARRGRRWWIGALSGLTLVGIGLLGWSLTRPDPLPWPAHAWTGGRIEAGGVLRYSTRNPPRVRLAAPVSAARLRLRRDEVAVNLALTPDRLGEQHVLVAAPPAEPWPAGPAVLELSAPAHPTERIPIEWGLPPEPPADLTEADVATLAVARRPAAWRALARAADAVERAIAYWRRAARAADAAGQPTEGARFRRAAAHSLIRSDHLSEAEALLREAEAISRPLDDALGLARAANLRGWIALRRGDARAADRAYRQAAAQAARAGDRRAFDKMRVLAAVTAQYAGRHAAALADLEALRAEPVERTGHALVDLDANDAWIRLRAAAQGAAPLPGRALVDRLVRSRDFLLSARQPAEAANLEENLALYALLAGDPAGARAWLETRRARAVPGNDPWFAVLLDGRIALAAGELEAAAAAFTQVRDGTTDAVDRRAEYGWRARFGLARVALARADHAAARRHLDAALEGMARQASQTPIDTSRAAFFADHRALVEAAVGLALQEGRLADAFTLIDADRARLTQALDTHLRVERLPADARRRFFADRAALLAESARFEAARRAGELARDQAAWAAERRAQAARLRAAFDALHATLDAHAPPPRPADAVRLRADERVLSGWRQGGALHVFLAGPDGVTRPDAWWAALPPRGHVWIVDGPDAEALRARVPTALTVARVPYAGWLARPRGASAGAPVVVGDPDGTLPAARAEASRVAQTLGVTPLPADGLGPAALLQRIDGARLFHFAGHGVLTTRDPFAAHLRLGDRARLGIVDVLMARPAIGLTVLSGCDTGARGALAGEHAIGLAQGFLTAGTERVLAAIRPVDDRATRRFMTRFYAANGAADPASALRQVQAGDGPWRLWGRR